MGIGDCWIVDINRPVEKVSLFQSAGKKPNWDMSVLIISNCTDPILLS